MHLIILCGGSGTRLGDYSLPKPLNMINGKPSISYCLENLPKTIDTLHFIAAPHLAKYNFEEIVKNQFKQRKCIVHWIPYFTRGPVETAWLGTSEFPETNEPVIFLDNDVIYKFPENIFEQEDYAFIGYAVDNSSSEAFSFLSINNGFVTNYKEKMRISSNFCCGVYGFKNIKQFRDAASAIMNNGVLSELYMSLIYQEFLSNKIPIRAIMFTGDIYHIGSLNELKTSWDKITKQPMRVCFDLDNTLVTYPSTPGDYTTVKPVSEMINLARKMKSEGHTIIIHTARRMATHKNNVGSVIKDIGALTFKTLDDFNIPYDEILFGKPIADIYIDDRAVNPYISSIESMGYLYPIDIKPMNMLGTNKYNKISIMNDKVNKSGPTSFLRGEIFFYENIPSNSRISSYFPKLYAFEKGEDISSLLIEHIKGIPFYTLFKQGLITENHILRLFDMLDILHNIPGKIPSQTDMCENYTTKLEKRFEILSDYPFEDASEIQGKCLNNLKSYSPSGAAYIHGDLWFSNMIIDFKGEIKWIDMKGQVNNQLTTGGDKLYDYAKLYQSFLGYDSILYNDSISKIYSQSMTDIFLREASKRLIDTDKIKIITFSLVIGTLHSITNIYTKQRVWDFIKSTFSN
jgi:capsule biosynthesis phosphatase